MSDVNNVIPVSIEQELEDSYLSYAMSVIVSRAIPDIRDGLKPVHRRILYSMYKSGYDYGKPYKKAARVVGDVMGKYHPHADAAIYDSLVRMAQDFSLLLPLIDSQGNFGSIDGDPPASMRYTEARLAKAAHFLLNDIDEDTVDFRPNYDENEVEPVVLPAEFPNILVNGAGGVAVGMSTNIPSHNLGEVIDACIAYIDNPEITFDELINIVRGPDFPTGGTILGDAGIRSAFMTGKGTIIIQGKTHLEDLPSGKQAIIIDEIPYQVNKAKLIERIHELIKEKKIEGILDLRDESNKMGIRVAIELKKQVSHQVILNQILGLTPLRTSFSINTLVLDNNKPKVMSLPDIISTFVEYRKEVLTRRTQFRLRKVRERAHLYIGMYIAVLNIDKVIAIIRSSRDTAEATKRLLECKWDALTSVREMIELVADSKSIVIDNVCQLTGVQVKSILEMKLQRLTNLEKEKLELDLKSMVSMIKQYTELLKNKESLLQLIKDGFKEIKAKLAVPRRTTIDYSHFETDIEDLIPKEDMVVTVTMSGYIKRAKLSNYRAQKRGGKGRIGQAIKEEDVITNLFVVNTHTSVLFFSNIGRVYKLKVYKLPLGEPTSRGRSLVNIFPLSENESITSVMPLPDNVEDAEILNIVFATASGNLRRNALSDFQYVPSNGKIAMVLDTGDTLISVKVCKEEDHVLLSTRLGKSIRFSVSNVRQFKGRMSDGVRAIKLSSDDNVISMSVLLAMDIDSEKKDLYLKVPLDKRMCVKEEGVVNGGIAKILCDLGLEQDIFVTMVQNEQFILTVTENGFGKRTSAYEYRTTLRGGVGVVNILTTARNGNVVASFPVESNDHIMLITDKGKLIRIAVSDIRIIGRSTQGVTLFKTEKREKVVSVAKIIDAKDNSDIDGNI
ncbi:DNA gyrase, A subunit [Ehrlichia chaffeensis str. Heartland]|uniref:DNA gyrase subunit A n=1 Tax=Ehrlichia chaffeensis (strain ATCC CRL-10679 / Arkansas) TaxID=205920 RepID=Q2GFY0_EHRCR|nr:DNA topoisomerase (ATP-hydrolyzing) subunit A [Ehrlichia chaffeensis]ABD44722.1 DNA gyrase, A subunit [Ehrlichia chaffeensis str. Arkansas]AHX03904.1 DNA gyrase, A subunit [Ehrlichia chaffeensis str. Heartland]AHX07191.1 DNA gyrase, A subunit [Ehrlichia chaffeensis str. Osceola]AHX08766.1 DNA gyrase, A subunit [Ehrlichia chaffeensis str. Saint Vincent]AHX10410.1 DNA gyrase, A subunit [Ehrlichia chaffeensis str. West Paces]